MIYLRMKQPSGDRGGQKADFFQPEVTLKIATVCTKKTKSPVTSVLGLKLRAFIQLTVDS
ncbi:hypothetical protein C7B67_05510 [filamentous cyanobacterium Phorm 6]|nr:hypothetical protein C7B67_05510 [filamentous cyanobacterium Phorm 6]